ncbi:DUF3159 domain-containing protein [Streptomyces sp. 3N207]|uniref:DUF3159 domain-containing protein n=1 Tax=Streptomyces sp. 3N207 TaxID=3457417 RepID=UPI003FD373CE
MAIAADRLRRKESIVPAIGGMLGVAIAAGISWRTGSAKDYFLFGVRYAVQGHLYQADKVDARGVAKIVMGYPLMGVCLLVVAWAARCSSNRLKASDCGSPDG